MTTVDAEDILRAMKALLDSKNALPSVDEFPKFRIGLDLALSHCWRSEWWPDLMPDDESERYFRANWLAGSTYAKTDEVYDAATQAYYQCLRNAVTGAGFSPTDSAGVERSAYWAKCKSTYSGANWVTATAYAVGDIKFYPVNNRYYQCHTAHTSSATLVPDATAGNERWGVLTSFLRTISKSQTGRLVIGDCFDVKNGDPRVSNRYTSLPWDATASGILVRSEVTRVWLQFRLPCPRLKGNLFDADLSYAVGQQVYFDNAGTQVGNFYDCVTAATPGESPASAAAKWEVVEIPEMFYGALVHRGVSKMMVSEGQDDRAAVPAGFAEEDLSLQTDVLYRQQGQTPALPVRPYR